MCVPLFVSATLVVCLPPYQSVVSTATTTDVVAITTVAAALIAIAAAMTRAYLRPSELIRTGLSSIVFLASTPLTSTE